MTTTTDVNEAIRRWHLAIARTADLGHFLARDLANGMPLEHCQLAIARTIDAHQQAETAYREVEEAGRRDREAFYA